MELRSAAKPSLCISPVSFLVGFTGCRVRKSLVAVPTAERLLPGVNTHVSLEISSVGEFLPTVLQRRDCAVRNEARKPLEAKSVCVTVTVTKNSLHHQDFHTCITNICVSCKYTNFAACAEHRCHRTSASGTFCYY